jgi:Tat protein secretion system quality control protein TatD with DNase activity
MFGIGEIGLDYRKPTLEKNTKEDQLSIFTEQLELSFLMNRSATVHCVYAHGEMLKIFK